MNKKLLFLGLLSCASIINASEEKYAVGFLVDALVARKSEAEIDALLGTINVHAPTDPEYGIMPLHEAARMGSTRAVELLLDRGADVNAKNKDGYTVLHYAVRLSRNDEICGMENNPGGENLIATLIKRGASPYAVDHDGDTPLHRACLANDCCAMRVLLANVKNKKVLLSKKNKRGQTPCEVYRVNFPINQNHWFMGFPGRASGIKYDLSAGTPPDRDIVKLLSFE